MTNSNKGLVLLYIGNGVGMTAAAVGQTFRSLGRGLRVCFMQFVSESWKHGEFVPSELGEDRAEFHALGKGYMCTSDHRENDREVARCAWDFAREKIASRRFDLVVLDELTELITASLLPEREVLRVLAERPKEVNVIITGRAAPEALINVVDLVTEVRELCSRRNPGVK